MKKWLIILGIITCMAGLTACGKQEQDAENVMPTQDALDLGASLARALDQIEVVSQGSSDYVSYAAAQLGIDEAVLENAVASWMGATGDMGNYIETVEVTENTMEYEEYYGSNYPVSGTISVRLKGSEHDAIMEIVCDNYALISISTNIDYTFGESMARAGLNTLLGMGTVFAVLILISFIIAAFGLIPKLFEPKKPVENKKADDIVSQIVEREELSDDTELVAVIAAAIAAYEGSGSTDGFVVRSIRKAKNSKW
ncbi:MAG: OadG family protein [Lachnospiraceae bacterium]|nr:OadG family protein [Lachnospiraceae bacterium]